MYRNAPPNMTSPRLWLRLNPNHARHRLIFGSRAIVECSIAVRSLGSRGVKLRGLPRSLRVSTPCAAPSSTKMLEPTMRRNWTTTVPLGVSQAASRRSILMFDSRDKSLHRLDLLHGADALTAAPDIFPGLLADGIACTKIHLAGIALFQGVRVEAGIDDGWP